MIHVSFAAANTITPRRNSGPVPVQGRPAITPEARTVLLMIRCGFLGGRRALTRRGRGLLPRWAWEAYVRVRCAVDSSFRGRVVVVLKEAERMRTNADTQRPAVAGTLPPLVGHSGVSE